MQGVTQAMDAEWRANEAMLVQTEALKDPKEKAAGKASGAAAKAFEEAEADLKQVFVSLRETSMWLWCQKDRTWPHPSCLVACTQSPYLPLPVDPAPCTVNP